MDDSTWEEYSFDYPAPPNLTEYKKEIAEFCCYHMTKENKVVLITSGGTIVPIEQNTIRFVDNFSAGTRGSASAEYFLDSGYAVIFMHRTKSLEPFTRHIIVKELMKSFCITKNSEDTSCKIEVGSNCAPKLLPVIQKFQEVTRNNFLIQVPFTTLAEYMHLLYAVSCILHPMKERAMMFLAAAVSDFYIPPKSMPIHKVNSNEQLDLDFQMTPKVLKPLVQHWAPQAFVVSFKLETDETILIEKSRRALETYGHKLVIANLLDDRKRRVIVVDKTRENIITMSSEEIDDGKEIEEKIVEKVIQLHNSFISENGS